MKVQDLPGCYVRSSGIAQKSLSAESRPDQIALGVITAALALVSLYRPSVTFDSLITLMGVMFIVSPWVMSFSDTAYRPMAWTAWIVGVVSLVAGAGEFQLERSEHRGLVTNR